MPRNPKSRGKSKDRSLRENTNGHRRDNRDEHEVEVIPPVVPQDEPAVVLNVTGCTGS
jgi:hypothetical protein